MADYHVRAVQRHCSLVDREVRNVLECIALDVGYDDTPAVTGYQKIGERVRLNRNKVGKCIECLIECNLLIMNKINNRQHYNLNPDTIPYHSEKTSRRKHVKQDSKLVTEKMLQDELSKLRALHKSQSSQLSQISSQLSQLLSQSSRHSREKCDISIESKESVRQGNIDSIDISTPPHYQNLQEHLQPTEILNPHIKPLVDCILDISKSTSSKKNDVENAIKLAEICVGKEITVDVLREGFSRAERGKNSYWYDKSFGKDDGNKAYVNNMITELDEFIQWRNNGSKLPKQANRNSHVKVGPYGHPLVRS